MSEKASGVVSALVSERGHGTSTASPAIGYPTLNDKNDQTQRYPASTHDREESTHGQQYGEHSLTDEEPQNRYSDGDDDSDARDDGDDDDDDDSPGSDLYPQPTSTHYNQSRLPQHSTTAIAPPQTQHHRLRGSKSAFLPAQRSCTASVNIRAAPSSSQHRTSFGAVNASTKSQGRGLTSSQSMMSLSYQNGCQGMMQMLRALQALEEEHPTALSTSPENEDVLSSAVGAGLRASKDAEVGGDAMDLGSDDEECQFGSSFSCFTTLASCSIPAISLLAPQHFPPMASSIHAIYKPIARKRTEAALRSSALLAASPSSVTASPIALSSMPEETQEDDDEQSGRDSSNSRPRDQRLKGSTSSIQHHDDDPGRRRRRRLAQKLLEVFQLPALEDIVAEFPCWLFRSVLLEGFMYLTTGHICFYAYLRNKEGQSVRSGSMSKRTGKVRRYQKHWFVLKDAVLAWYPSSTEPYFPDGQIDLHYCTAVVPSENHELHFKVVTTSRRYHFSADSAPSRDDWVKVIQKVVFTCQNEGDSVKIAIPFETVEQITQSTSLEFAETIVVATKEVAMSDDDEEDYGSSAPEDYYFAFFQDVRKPLGLMVESLGRFRDIQGTITTADKVLLLTPRPSACDAALPVPDAVLRDSTRRTSGGLSPVAVSKQHSSDSDASQLATTPTTPAKKSTSESPLQRASSLSSKLRIPGLKSPRSPNVQLTDQVVGASPPTLKRNLSGETIKDLADSKAITPSTSPQTYSLNKSLLDVQHTYPPGTSSASPSSTQQLPGSSVPSDQTSAWTILPSWLRSAPAMGAKGLIAAPALATALVRRRPVQRKVSETVLRGNEYLTPRPKPTRKRTTGFEDPFGVPSGTPILEDQEDGVTTREDMESVAAKFRHMFSLQADEQLLVKGSCYLFRGIPIYGRIFVSQSHLCFKGSRPMAGTIMILPLRDIISMQEQKGFRFGYSGLIVTVKGYEEIFFEFSTHEQRIRVTRVLRKRDEDIQAKLKLGTGLKSPSSRAQEEAIVLKDLEPDWEIDDEELGHQLDNSDSVPPIMFRSTSSSFVTFKPREPMHITCLTIGSRGDVQPYIALCKGLMADGHKCRIASHPEYRSWVEAYGIEFAEVGGDPAELMRICVENGMFTVSFLREGVTKFRGWLDDLLATSWQACQGTQLLIESPSTMAGIHIAEGLQIPYFRAFTMPWTRTRAYPHAFAVPEHKMGGGYNFMTYTMFDAIFWRAIAGQVNRWRKQELKLQSTSIEKLEPHRVPFLYNFSQQVVPPPLDWYEWIHVTGYWFLDGNDDAKAGSQWQPPKELVMFLDLAKRKSKKVVYIGFGSIVVSDPEGLSRTIVEAVRKAGVFAIVSRGWSDRLSSPQGKAPEAVTSLGLEKEGEKEVALVDPIDDASANEDGIFKVDSVPHDWLFPQVSAACHHGGAGTTGASLRAGIPTIIRPFFGDQYFWADRVENLGIGTALRKMTVKTLATALVAATTDVRQISRAKTVGEQIRGENGVASAMECIYRDLEYANSLIKTDTRLDSKPKPIVPSGSIDTSGNASPLRRHAKNRSARSGETPSGGPSDEESSWDVLSQAKSERTDLASSFDRLSEPRSPSRSNKGRSSSSHCSEDEDDCRRLSQSGSMLNRISSPVRMIRTSIDLEGARTSTATLIKGALPSFAGLTSLKSKKST